MRIIEIPAGMETELFVMERQAVQAIPEVLQDYFPDRKFWLIADENTWLAAGRRVHEILLAAGCPEAAEPRIFPGSPRLHPLESISRELASSMDPDTVPVAVGSGVINDLVKRGAGIAGVPYCCVPTAASVDGYTSYGGAMSVDGRKMTMPCPAPLALVADLDILEAAPREMFSSGYADLLTKVPAGADWQIAAVLGIEPVEPRVWNLVQRDLRSRVMDTGGLEGVFLGLAGTGYSMQLYRDSRPASGAEHMMSHVWEMEGLQYRGEEVSHGFKVGIGTLVSCILMDFILEHTAGEAAEMAAPPPSREERLQEIDGLLRRGCYGDAVPLTAMEKFLEGEELSARRRLIWEKWPLLQEKIRAQIFSLGEFRRLLSAAGAPVRCQDIGLSMDQLLHGVRTAQLIRKRYTVLDLLYEAGLLAAGCRRVRELMA